MLSQNSIEKIICAFSFFLPLHRHLYLFLISILFSSSFVCSPSNDIIYFCVFHSPVHTLFLFYYSISFALPLSIRSNLKHDNFIEMNNNVKCTQSASSPHSPDNEKKRESVSTSKYRVGTYKQQLKCITFQFHEEIHSTKATKYLFLSQLVHLKPDCFFSAQRDSHFYLQQEKKLYIFRSSFSVASLYAFSALVILVCLVRCGGFFFVFILTFSGTVRAAIGT